MNIQQAKQMLEQNRGEIEKGPHYLTQMHWLSGGRKSNFPFQQALQGFPVLPFLSCRETTENKHVHWMNDEVASVVHISFKPERALFPSHSTRAANKKMQNNSDLSIFDQYTMSMAIMPAIQRLGGHDNQLDIVCLVTLSFLRFSSVLAERLTPKRP